MRSITLRAILNTFRDGVMNSKLLHTHRSTFLGLAVALAAWFFILVPLPATAADQPAQVTYTYDQLGRLIGVRDPSGNTATYKYDAVGNIVSISRTAAGQVAVLGFTPGGGAAGTPVTVFGNGFSATPADNQVTFNETPATVVSASATQIVTRVPVGATTGAISVTTPAGSARSNEAFVIAASQAPAITAFSPLVGPAGTAIAINGTNFDANSSANKVSLNGRNAVVTAASSVSMMATAPPNSSSGKITVATVYGSATSSGDFFVVPSPYTAADVAVTGRMAIGESRAVTIDNAGKKGLIVFDGVAGQQVSLQLSGMTMASVAISVLGPDGVTLKSTTLSGSTGFIDAFTLPSSGTYTIFVNPSASSKGSATILLQSAQDVTGTIAIGAPAVTLSTTVPGQNIRLSFSGTAGQRISMSATHTLDCPTITILKPDGTTLAGGLTCGSNYFIDTTTLPVAGTYTILVNPRDANIGRVTLTLMEVPPDATAPIAIGAPAVTLSTTVPGQNIRLSFSGTAGQRISMSATHTLDCPTITILKPDGTTLAGGLTCGSSYFIDTTTVPVAGTYTILVNPRDANVGRVTLTLMEVPPDATAPIAIGAPAVTLSTTVPGQNIRLSFSGTAGQRISMGATHTLDCPTITILKPDGTTLAGGLTCSSNYFIDTTTLPVAGTYTILVNPRDANVGRVTLTLMEVPPDATAPIAIGAPAVTLSTTVPGQNVRLSFSGTAGQRISMGATHTLDCPTITILKPDGTTLAGGLTCSSNYFIDTTTLPVAGTYTILVNPRDANVGRVTLTLMEVPPDATAPIAIGAPAVTLSTTVPGQNVRLSFSGTAGQRISMGAAHTLDCPTITILKPDGTTLAGGLTCSSNYFIDTTTLPVAGTYTILVNPRDANVGRVTLTLMEVPPDATAPIAIGAPAVTLSTTVPGQNIRLNLTGAAGQKIRLSVTAIAPSLDCPRFSILKPDGTALLGPNLTCGSSYSVEAPAFPVSGTYVIVMDPRDANTGSATFAITAVGTTLAATPDTDNQSGTLLAHLMRRRPIF
jgi:YD repeat-containing protein